MGKAPKYVSAAYLSERTSLTARWFTGQACEGRIASAPLGTHSSSGVEAAAASEKGCYTHSH